MESKVELFARIRRDARVRSLSIRGLAREHRVSRRTVRQALAAAEPPVRRVPAREPPKLGPLKGVIDAMLLADLDAPRKQRHTAQRIFDRLVDGAVTIGVDTHSLGYAAEPGEGCFVAEAVEVLAGADE
jgi:transposase